jgi:hypothetical protein
MPTPVARQENTKGEEIFRPGECKRKTGSLSIDRMTLDTSRLSCGFDTGTASDSTPKMRMLCTEIELVIEPMDQQ